MKIINAIWGYFTFKDIVDIFIVTILIYQVLLIVRGTRAVQMLIGVGILLLLFWVGLFFKLYSLNWILDHFFDSFFIIAIVLFQDQFRRALATVGAGRKMWGIFNPEVEELELEEVIEACAVLSKERVGGIIVFERRYGLMNYMATGTTFGATIHSDLIYAIFQSRSPLHDGAIIISSGRLAAAGCFLPLSKNVEIDRHWGTRHRAALGLSEDTDALIITISEETGKIHVFIEGSYYLCKDTSTLREYVNHIWNKKKLGVNLMPLKAKGFKKRMSQCKKDS